MKNDCRRSRPSLAAMRPIAAIAALAALCGCSLPPVQPWEKGDLAKPAMTFESDPLAQAFREHVYSSREGAAGGTGVAGGGCGCN